MTVAAPRVWIADEIAWLLPLVILPALVLAAVALHFCLRRIRFSLLDFCVLVWVTGVAMGLASRAILFLDETWIGMAVAAGGAGALVFFGGMLGLWAANSLRRERPAGRALLQLRGVLFFLALIGAVALPCTAFGLLLSLNWEAAREKMLAEWMKTGLVLLLGPLALGLLLLHGWGFFRLLRRSWQAAREKSAAPDDG